MESKSLDASANDTFTKQNVRALSRTNVRPIVQHLSAVVIMDMNFTTSSSLSLPISSCVTAHVRADSSTKRVTIVVSCVHIAYNISDVC